MKIVYEGISETGSRRTVNQDRIGMFAAQDAALFAVADGMGGHMAGEKASNEIIFGLKIWWDAHFSLTAREETLEGTLQLEGTGTEKLESTFEMEETKERGFHSYLESLSKKLREINQKIYQVYNGTKICGSTVVILFLYKGQYAILSAGDSRIYEKTMFSIRQLNVDDTWSEMARRTKSMSDAQIMSHPDRDKLINAVGTFKQLEVSITTGILKRHQMFFLCSDGIYKSLTKKELDTQIKKLYRYKDRKLDLSELKARVYHAGANDNLSAIAVIADSRNSDAKGVGI